MATIDASTAIDDTVAETLHRQWLDRSASKALAALQYVWYLTITLALMVLNMVVPRRFSLVETTPFIDATQFEWHEWVIGEMGKVQAELEDLLAAPERIPNHQDIIETIAAISNDDKWLSYFFYIYGQRFDKQCESCPDTARLLENIPGMETAFFSILSPGKKIPPHRGPYRGVIRYHLPLLVPRHGECGIRVGNETASFQEGVVLMFDDTYEHEVWNNTDETRVVLFLDITRPMKFPFNVFNSAMIRLMGRSPVVRRMQKKQAAFDRAVAESA
ncbi:aspartyl/asparaginyl beta-hydroxylase domain-containing protein [Mycobacterium intracellulare]|uniref:aspartyl/asparaginyl beta-hydroxylase domain-containing protein n=1 Tax=Mycobacterium intracellulare TaxID=1767 RepID=UPI001CD99C39|nr:aspartyl/asparaginyl beta-hydroxylase domain-containing protein [Mycobacterium intracellulare]MCA2246488.1 aspartyl/asparaginyl beta-hydroxylase domain-containing protein [Mycobacterium intracellulare]MCA2254234.1 aspartyl/asparaginyl beta-hydroxylase domain-containing protein [Mycobacterium intracellulare]UGT96520.1 aspartyl/asparaginyl beta-hydroxylase domain-containing protein [Mycobacterium intracellulare]UGU01327.1 aspartyl/asparaginyl beta-hydroxylase domain-containing protein [Mycobac